MTDIDYEALGKIADDSYCNPDHTIADCARAVVAALRDQGLVVVRAEGLRDIAKDIEWASGALGGFRIDWAHDTEEDAWANARLTVEDAGRRLAALAGTMSGLPPGDDDGAVSRSLRRDTVSRDGT
jgi:hypothetical protein